MNENSPLRPYAKGILAAAALLLLPAVVSLFSALVSAVQSGQVMVISIGRYETARQLVPWAQGWSRFAAPLVILSAIVLWSMAKPHKLVWWLSASLAALGVGMLLCSLWFISWQGVIAFASLLAFICVALYIGNRFGSFAAVAFVVLVVVIALAAANAA